MAKHPQTIQIFLPNGDPQGIRVAAVTTRIVRVIEVPRSALVDFSRMAEAHQVGLYFLVGEVEGLGLPQIYIGQTGTLSERLGSHHKTKDFWSRALVVVSVTNSLTNTHASYLEWLSIQQAGVAERYVLENGNAGSRPHTPAPPLEAECVELHETIRVLLATLGYPVFESLTRRQVASGLATQSIASDQTQARYYCRGSGAHGIGMYTAEGFVVLKGSTGKLQVTPSFLAHHYAPHRQRLIEQGILAIHGDRVHFERDYLSKSPSFAAVCLLGRAANGWTEWKDSNGRTLSEVSGREST